MPVQLRSFDLAAFEATPVETYAIFVGEDERPLWGLGGLLDWKLAAGLSRHLQQQQLLGEPHESVLMPTYGRTPGSRIFAFGIGPLSQLTAESFAEHARIAVEKLQRAKVTSLAIGLPEVPALTVTAPTLVKALQPLNGIETFLFGPARDLEQALPELAQRTRR